MITTEPAEVARFRPIDVVYADTVYLAAAESRLDAARMAIEAIEGFIRAAREAGEDPAAFFLRNEFLTLKEDGSDVVESYAVETPRALESAQ